MKGKTLVNEPKVLTLILRICGFGTHWNNKFVNNVFTNKFSILSPLYCKIEQIYDNSPMRNITR